MARIIGQLLVAVALWLLPDTLRTVQASKDHSMRQVECQKLLRARGTPGLRRGQTTPGGEKSSGGPVCDGEQGLAIATGPLMTYGGTGGDQRREP